MSYSPDQVEQAAKAGYEAHVSSGQETVQWDDLAEWSRWAWIASAWQVIECADLEIDRSPFSVAVLGYLKESGK